MTTLRILAACFLLCWLAAGCGAGVDTTPSDNEAQNLAEANQELVTRAITSSGPFVVYDNPYADGTANPAANITGIAAAAFTSSGRTFVALTVAGLPADRVFGAHVHRLACEDTKGGTHYQNVVSPTTVTDPAYANAANEVWLDFTSNGNGKALSTANANFIVRRDEANAIVIHTNATGAGGVAGAKLACINLDF
jgi:Cu-Zn family superoxide dismutase